MNKIRSPKTKEEKLGMDGVCVDLVERMFIPISRGNFPVHRSNAFRTFSIGEIEKKLNKHSPPSLSLVLLSHWQLMLLFFFFFFPLSCFQEFLIVKKCATFGSLKFFANNRSI